MSAQPAIPIHIPPTVEFISEADKSRRIIERRLNFLRVFEELSSPGGLTGWRLVGAEPDPEPETASSKARTEAVYSFSGYQLGPKHLAKVAG